LKKCSKGEICPGFNSPSAVDSDCITPTIPTATKYPGESCSTTTDTCTLGTCTNGKCPSASPNGAVGDPCTGNDKCAVGNYCTLFAATKVCAAQINDTTTKCNNNYECASNMGCGIDQTCINYFSVVLGGLVPAGGNSLCVTGYANMINNKFYCLNTKLQADKQTTAWQCNADASTCTYDLVGAPKDVPAPAPIIMGCVCSLSSPTIQYCPADTSDSRFANLLSNKSVVNKGVHTLRRLTGTTSFNKYSVWPKYEGADSCVQAMLSSTYVSLSLFLLAILALLL
jgi:hypothetical protein